jgi:hypothetical protein
MRLAQTAASAADGLYPVSDDIEWRPFQWIPFN